MNAAPQKRSWHFWAACGFWLLIFLIITGDAVRRPTQHTTMPTYRFASTQWWHGQDPYTFDAPPAPPVTSESSPWWMQQHDDFVYIPQAAVLFTPFNLLPFYLGEILWRVVVFGLFAYALMRLTRFFLLDNQAPPAKTFLVMSLLAVPSSMASLRNAQFDLPLAALLVLAAAEIAVTRLTAAAFWLCLSFALKPLAAVPLLLFGAHYGKLIPRLAVGLLIVAALPFLHWNPAFVAHEYVRCAQALAWASKGDAPKFSDLSALLSHLGCDAPNNLKTIVRVLFALIYLGLGFAAVRRLNASAAAWTIGALSADYLMLFNPRTETCSYVFLGPWIASLAVLYLRQPAQKWLGYALGFGALCLACDAFPKISPALDVHMLTDRWLKPLIALLFLPVLVRFIFNSRKAQV